MIPLGLSLGCFIGLARVDVIKRTNVGLEYRQRDRQDAAEIAEIIIVIE
jgi:hypothetical protein